MRSWLIFLGVLISSNLIMNKVTKPRGGLMTNKVSCVKKMKKEKKLTTAEAVLECNKEVK